MDDTLAKIVMIAVLGAAAPIGGEIDVWSQWGLAGAVVAYTLFRDFHREKRLAESIEQQQVWLRDTFMTTLQKNTEALNSVAELLETQYVEDDEQTP